MRRLQRQITSTASAVVAISIASHPASASVPGDFIPLGGPDNAVAVDDAQGALDAAVGALVADPADLAPGDVYPGTITDPDTTPPTYAPTGGDGVGMGDALTLLGLATRAFAIAHTFTVRVASWDDLSGDPGMPTISTPPGVVSMRFAVTDAAMSGPETTFLVPGLPDVSVEAMFTTLPAAMQRVEIEARDGADAPLYRGVRYVDVDATAEVVLVPVVSVADTTPPVLTGPVTARAWSKDIVELDWPHATDDVSPARDIRYLIYAAATPYGHDFGAPSYVTAPGETSIVIPDAAPGRATYYVVRAMDAAGNLEAVGLAPAKAAMVQAVTRMPGDGFYVDVAAGADDPDCGAAASPCRTLTQALSLTAGDEPLYVLPGEYSEATGEVFPLALKEGTSLQCSWSVVGVGLGRGLVWRRVTIRLPDAPDPPIAAGVLGAQNAAIWACNVEHDGTGIGPQLDADTNDMRVAWARFKGAPDRNGFGVRAVGTMKMRSTIVERFNVGMTVVGDESLIVDSEFRNNQLGFNSSVAPGASQLVVRSYFHDNLTGVTSSFSAEGSLVFAGCTVSDNNDGFSPQSPGPLRIESSVIVRNVQRGVVFSLASQSEPYAFVGNTIARNGLGIQLIRGDAEIRGNTIACNDTVGLIVQEGAEIDARYNRWDNNPPTIDPGAPLDPECPLEDPTDICYFRDYAGTPEPLTDPTNGAGGCGVDAVVY